MMNRVRSGKALAALALLLVMGRSGAESLPLLRSHADPVALQAARQQPLQFAVDAALEATLADGQWSIEGNARHWRLRIRAEGATGTALHLASIQLPRGALLRWSRPDGAQAQTWPAHPDGAWWTPEVIGDEGLLHLQMPLDAPGTVSLRLQRVFHRFPAIRARAAGSCNVDTACPEGDAWTHESESSVRLTIDNRFLCSGALIDNTARDDRALLISARHCGITAETARSVNARFGFRRSGCGSGPVQEGVVVEGSRWIGESEAADTTLVELTALPERPFTPRFAGWNAEPASLGFPASGAGLHHPSGDVLKISLFDQPARPADAVDIGDGDQRFRTDAWSVVWRRGVTESGSSGSGLWNESRELVGVLSGGNSSCSTPEGRDFYGRLDRAYDSSPDIARALDPLGSGQARRLPPRSPTRTDTLTGGPGLATDGGGGGFGLLILVLVVLIRRDWSRP